MAIICETNESTYKVTTSNVTFSSVKFASTINVINKSIESINCYLSYIISTRSTIDPATKSVLRIIKSEIVNISDYNSILKKETVPSLTTRASSTYAHKRIIYHPPSLMFIVP